MFTRFFFKLNYSILNFRCIKPSLLVAAIGMCAAPVKASPDDYLIEFGRAKSFPISQQDNHRSNGDKFALDAFLYLQDNKDPLISSPVDFLEKVGLNLLSARANQEIRKAFAQVPLLANTSLNIDFASGAAPSIGLNSLLSLKAFRGDQEGLLNGIIFSQHRFEKANKKDGSTINNGIGARFKIHKDTVLGINGFWDYRLMTEYSSHSRFGLGSELWHKNFEFTNNWYIAGTKTKKIKDTSAETVYERVVPGWDVKFAYRFPKANNLSTYIRGFRWDYHSTSDNSGVALGVNWEPSPGLNVNFDISNEIPSHITYARSNLGENIYARVNFTWFFNKSKSASYDLNAPNTIGLMTRPVQRNYQVKLERYSSGDKNPSSFNVRVSASGN